MIFGGADLSFCSDSHGAVVVVSVLASDLTLIWVGWQICTLESDYVPGKLALRECTPIVEILQLLDQQCSSRETETFDSHSDIKTILLKQIESGAIKGFYGKAIWPDVLLIDGNGQWHHEMYGLASHVFDQSPRHLPCIGVAKQMLMVHGWSRETARQLVHRKERVFICQAKEGIFQGKVLGAAVRTNPNAVRDVYVSIGGGLSLEEAVEWVLQVSQTRYPEPLKSADKLGRFIIQQMEFTSKS